MKQWAIIELFGHTTLAGFVQPDPDFPTLIRLDVPETQSVPAWTKLIGPNAVYAMTPVSEETARLKAESLEAVPINVYDIRGHIKRSMEADALAVTQHGIGEMETGLVGLFGAESDDPTPNRMDEYKQRNQDVVEQAWPKQTPDDDHDLPY